jgi:hypothetical protein
MSSHVIQHDLEGLLEDEEVGELNGLPYDGYFDIVYPARKSSQVDFFFQGVPFKRWNSKKPDGGLGKNGRRTLYNIYFQSQDDANKPVEHFVSVRSLYLLVGRWWSSKAPNYVAFVFEENRNATFEYLSEDFFQDHIDFVITRLLSSKLDEYFNGIKRQNIKMEKSPRIFVGDYNDKAKQWFVLAQEREEGPIHIYGEYEVFWKDEQTKRLKQ